MADELLGSVLCDRLSKMVRNNSSFADALAQLFAIEKRHFQFWEKSLPSTEARFSQAKPYLVLLFYRVFGVTFAVRYLERQESKTIREYGSAKPLSPQETEELSTRC